MIGMRMADGPKDKVWVVLKVRIYVEMTGQFGGPIRHRGWETVISFRAAMACSLRSGMRANLGLTSLGAVEFSLTDAGCKAGPGLSIRGVPCVC